MKEGEPNRKNERRVFASDPDFAELDDLARKIAIANNPTLDFNGRQAVESGELPTLERRAIVETLKTEMDKKLEGGIFRDEVTRLNMLDLDL